MRRSSRSEVLIPLDVKTLLASVEAAPPIDAAEVVAAALTDALGARDVSFLIADYSGQALVRLSHVRRASADEEDVNREPASQSRWQEHRMAVRSPSRRFRSSRILGVFGCSLP
jgi:hypothetical protein